jgi:hypothetical protein
MRRRKGISCSIRAENDGASGMSRFTKSTIQADDAVGAIRRFSYRALGMLQPLRMVAWHEGAYPASRMVKTTGSLAYHLDQGQFTGPFGMVADRRR